MSAREQLERWVLLCEEIEITKKKIINNSSQILDFKATENCSPIIRILLLQ